MVHNCLQNTLRQKNNEDTVEQLIRGSQDVVREGGGVKSALTQQKQELSDDVYFLNVYYINRGISITRHLQMKRLYTPAWMVKSESCKDSSDILLATGCL